MNVNKHEILYRSSVEVIKFRKPLPRPIISLQMIKFNETSMSENMRQKPLSCPFWVVTD